jgi:dihydropteroate synthase
MSDISNLWKRPKGCPLMMGILNLTPDSFSDGGEHFSKKDALEHAFYLIDSGADIIDIGGESTRPGSDPVSEEEELGRVIDVITELAPSIDKPISIDTMKPRVADMSLKAGAAIINDVSGLRSDEMIRVAVDYNAPSVIMHMHGLPKTFFTDTMKGDVNTQIKKYLDERAEYVVSKGMEERNIILDPGIGFGKTAEQDMRIVEYSGRFSDKYPVLIGPSRKKFLSQYYPRMDRDEATAIVSGISAENGASILRVHNVSRILSYLEKSSD